MSAADRLKRARKILDQMVAAETPWRPPGFVVEFWVGDGGKPKLDANGRPVVSHVKADSWPILGDRQPGPAS